MKILVVGIDSTIGQSVARDLTARGHFITGTTRRKNNDTHIFFDLGSDMADWPRWPEDIDVAFIAAAITRQSICSEDPGLARFVNVDQTLALAEQLLGMGIHVVYPSTNLVLACAKPLQPADAPLQPIGFYGQTKADMETNLSGKNATIARLPKILDRQSGILKTWHEKWGKGEPIDVFTNLIVAPVSLRYATEFIVKLIKSRPSGIWQISGEREVSYYEMAMQFLDFIERSDFTPLVNAVEMPDNGAALPKHPGMDCSLTERKFGLKSQPIRDVFAL